MQTKSDRKITKKYIKKTIKLGQLPFLTPFFANSAESGAWVYFFDETVAILRNDDEFEIFDTRSKMFAFYYTYVQVLGEYRGFVELLYATKEPYLPVANNFKTFEKMYKEFAAAIYSQGNETGEIASRMPVKGFLLQFLVHQLRWVTRTWVLDTTQDCEKTDAAIEKAVHFSFDVLQPNFLDSGFDIAKFLIQRRK